jgi:ADP-ribose pyrophosphatase YjhB (NUDIX family)
MKRTFDCPSCGAPIEQYANPIPTVDIIIRIGTGIVLIKRKNPPHGWALPGGFIDYGESAEHAAIREAREETSLDVTELRLFNVYSAPDRDPRHHTVGIVYTARAQGRPHAQDDALDVAVFESDTLPDVLAFDHGRILSDYFSALRNGRH